jgi:hypothetical protein
MSTMASSQQMRYTFPAVRGVQAGREYYVTMLPLRMLERLFRPDAEAPGPARTLAGRLSPAPEGMTLSNRRGARAVAPVDRLPRADLLTWRRWRSCGPGRSSAGPS